MLHFTGFWIWLNEPKCAFMSGFPPLKCYNHPLHCDTTYATINPLIQIRRDIQGGSMRFPLRGPQVAHGIDLYKKLLRLQVYWCLGVALNLGIFFTIYSQQNFIARAILEQFPFVYSGVFIKSVYQHGNDCGCNGESLARDGGLCHNGVTSRNQAERTGKGRTDIW